jgi:hypothetical protein
VQTAAKTCKTNGNATAQIIKDNVWGVLKNDFTLEFDVENETLVLAYTDLPMELPNDNNIKTDGNVTRVYLKAGFPIIPQPQEIRAYVEHDLKPVKSRQRRMF